MTSTVFSHTIPTNGPHIDKTAKTSAKPTVTYVSADGFPASRSVKKWHSLGHFVHSQTIAHKPFLPILLLLWLGQTQKVSLSSSKNKRYSLHPLWLHFILSARPFRKTGKKLSGMMGKVQSWTATTIVIHKQTLTARGCGGTVRMPH